MAEVNGAPRRRLRSCVEAWPECEEGAYNPACCRFPKSCSCTVYDEAHVSEGDLEPRPSSAAFDREEATWKTLR